MFVSPALEAKLQSFRKVLLRQILIKIRKRLFAFYKTLQNVRKTAHWHLL